MSRESKRRSFFGAIGLQTPKQDEEEPANLLRKRRTASLRTNLSAQTAHRADSDSVLSAASAPTIDSAVSPRIPQGRLSHQSSQSGRSSSVLGSFKGLRLNDGPFTEEPQPLSASTTRTYSGHWSQGDDALRNNQVLHHGEVQTSSSMFRKKKEYLVLTETHLMRFKSYQKAAEAFSVISAQRSGAHRHSQHPSAGSSHEIQSAPSESSGDRSTGTPLRQIVAVYRLDDGRPHYAFEISYLDDETNQASSMTLQFGDFEEMFTWLGRIREAANRVRLNDQNPLSAYNSHLAARVVEAERDYVPPHYAIYKVVQRPVGKGQSRASSDDLQKIAASVCFLAIGVHKVHLISLFKPPSQRTSSPALGSYHTQASYGILTITELNVSEVDDTFELTFR